MWLFTPTGFLSVVAHRDDPDVLLVRGRTAADVEHFASATGTGPVRGNAGTDYRWRVLAPRAVVRDYVAGQVDAIDYPNFKDAVADRQGFERAARYHDVWNVMWRLQQDEATADRDR